MQIAKRFLHFVFASGLVWCVTAATLVADDALARLEQLDRGKILYAEQCAACHGDQGEGVSGGYDSPLVGDLPPRKLAEVITETMPEEDPAACVGDDAEAVAAYIHEQFYSPNAQLRNAPPRFELARLTVDQYRQSVADLSAVFLGRHRPAQESGVKTEYFASRRLDRKHRKQDRLEARVDFDFGEGSPLPDQKETDAYSLAMRSSLYAPASGTYYLALETPNTAVLFFNDEDEPLIDARIRSGDQTRYEAKVELTGGRYYPFRIEYYRAEVGSKKVGATGNRDASLQLLWRRPHRTWEVVASRYLDPNWHPHQLTVTTPFPPDDSSVGYARGTTVSKAWDEATTSAALEVAQSVIDHLDWYAKLDRKDDDAKRREKIRHFLSTWIRHANRYRGSDKDAEALVDSFLEAAEEPSEAVRRVIWLSLKSPVFLYPELPIANPGDDVAVRHAAVNRLALGLWDSVPDENLRKAAEKGWFQLDQDATLRKLVGPMVQDPRARAKMLGFFHHWLHLDATVEMAKDREAYPDFSEPVITDLRESLDRMVEEIVWSDASDFRDLLTTRRLLLNDRLADYYDVKLPDGEGYRAIERPVETSGGVLTHPLLMAGFSYNETTSPIHRGVFLARNVLGRALRPPPVAVAPVSPDLHQSLTTRQRVAMQTKPATCASCHDLINPLGFAFENFDAVGRFREEEKDQSIDASGVYLSREGQEVPFDGADELTRFLATSPEAHESFVRHLFEHVTKQPAAAFGTDQLTRLTETFVQNDFNIQKLFIEIAIVYAKGPPQAST